MGADREARVKVDCSSIQCFREGTRSAVGVAALIAAAACLIAANTFLSSVGIVALVTIVGLVVLPVGAVLARMLIRSSDAASKSPGSLEVDGASVALRLDGARSRRKRLIRRGVVVRQPGSPMAWLALQGGREVFAKLDSEADAKAFEDELPQDARGGLVRVKEPSPLRGWFLGITPVLAYAIVVITPFNSFWLLPLLMVMLAFALVVWGTRPVSVGADGIRMRTSLWDLEETFIPFTEIKGVRTEDGTRPSGRRYRRLLVDLRDGTSRTVLDNPDTPDSIQEARAAVVEARIRARISKGSASPTARTDLFAYTGVPVSQWKERIVDARKAEHYRVAELDPEVAWACLDDPNATNDARLGAALFLVSAHDGDATRRRIRVAARDANNARVRVALNGIVEGDVDDEVLEQALAPRARGL
jgi:hypothetical protein